MTLESCDEFVFLFEFFVLPVELLCEVLESCGLVLEKRGHFLEDVG